MLNLISGKNLKSIMLIMKYSQLHGKSNDAYEEYSKDFVVDDFIAKSIGFTNGLNSTMFSTEDYARLRNIRLSHV
jgi:hypothetical protein